MPQPATLWSSPRNVLWQLCEYSLASSFLDVPSPTSANDLSAVLDLQPGTLCLLLSVINCDTLSVFRSRLKTHLFNTAYLLRHRLWSYGTTALYKCIIINCVCVLSGTTGYSTDRAENYFTDEQRSTSNTLTLSDRRKPPGQTGSGDGSMSSPVPMAGFEDDVCLLLLSAFIIKMLNVITIKVFKMTELLTARALYKWEKSQKVG